jgi:hypothetical protein
MISSAGTIALSHSFPHNEQPLPGISEQTRNGIEIQFHLGENKAKQKRLGLPQNGYQLHY